MNKTLLWTALLSVTFGLSAQDASDETATELSPITVTADPFAGRSPVEATQPTSVLGGDALERARGNTLGETLANQPGVHSADFSAGASRPVIRGLGGPRVRLLDGGAGIIDASSVSPDHNVAVEPFRARQIEILKGPATLLYGSGAIGGVINVVSDLVPDGPLHGAEGSLGYVNSSVDSGNQFFGHVGGGNGRFAFHLDGLTRDSDDYEVPGFADSDGAEEPDAVRGFVENSAVESDSFAGGASWTGNHGYLGIGLSRYTSLYGIPGHHEEEEPMIGMMPPAEEEEEVVRIDLEQTRTELRGGWNTPFGVFERARGSVVFTDYEHQELEGAEIGTLFANDGTELRLELTHRPTAGWRGVFGVQALEQEFAAIGEEAFVPPVDTRNLGLFIVEERDFAAHRLSLGARVETVEHSASGNPNRDYDLFSLSGGLHLELSEGNHLNINLSLAERAPDVQELYSDGPHLATSTFERGNLNLDTERALNLDVGYAGEYAMLFYGIDVFYTRYTDFIFGSEVDTNNDGEPDFVHEDGDVEPDGDLLLIDFLQEDADFFGFEAEFGVNLTAEHRLSVFTDLVRAERDSGDKLPRIPASRIGLNYSGGHGQLSYGASLVRVNRQSQATELEGDTDGYTLLGLDLGYRIPLGAGDIDLKLRARNLLDEEARNHVSFLKNLAPLPGANVIVNLAYSF